MAIYDLTIGYLNAKLLGRYHHGIIQSYVYCNDKTNRDIKTPKHKTRTIRLGIEHRHLRNLVRDQVTE